MALFNVESSEAEEEEKRTLIRHFWALMNEWNLLQPVVLKKKPRKTYLWFKKKSNILDRLKV